MMRVMLPGRLFYRLILVTFLAVAGAAAWGYGLWLSQVYAAKADLRAMGIGVNFSPARSSGTGRLGQFQQDYFPTRARITSGLSTSRDLDQAKLCHKLDDINLTVDEISFLLLDIDDRVVKSISRHKHVTVLAIQGDHITDEGLVALSSLKELEDLSLRCRGISDRGTVWLEHLPKLKVVQLVGNHLSNDTLRYLSASPELRFISVTSWKVTAEGIEPLAKLKSLEDLRLTRCRIDDSCAPHLKAMPALKRLGLAGTRVTDEICDTLTQMPALEEIDLRRTRVTEEGLQQLQDKLPKLKKLFPPAPSTRGSKK